MTRAVVQLVIGATATVVTAGTTYVMTKSLERRSTLKTAKELLALGRCPVCQREHVGICPHCTDKLLLVITNNGRTHKPGI